MLLDEATAALDPGNGAAIQDALDALAGGRTVLVIAGRLQTVAGADQIIVLDHGRVVEQGYARAAAPARPPVRGVLAGTQPCPGLAPHSRRACPMSTRHRASLAVPPQ